MSLKWLKAGWLVAAILVAIVVGVIEPRNRYRGISESRTTGVGVAAWEPISLWRQPLSLRLVDRVSGVVGGIPHDEAAPVQMASMMPYNGPTAPPAPPTEDRKLVRTGSMDLIVKNPANAAEKIRQLAERMGGFLVSSQVSGAQDALSAGLTIRVPAARFEEARAEIRKLALRVENDRIEAEDVTRNYVDREARLRNLHAQEQQYLGILKRATTVKDTLEVSEKLNEVRGQIEQQQAEFEALSKQIETVAITISLRAEADAQVFGLRWRPLYRLKIAAREGLEGLADYVATMTSLAFYLPTILLWLATILVGAAVGWRILRRVARVLFGWPKPAPTEGR